MKPKEVTASIDIAGSKLSRLERGEIGIHPEDLRKLLHLYDIRGPFRLALELHVRRERDSRWRRRSDGVDGGSLLFMSLEQYAATVREYQHTWVPALLQTGDYTRSFATRLELGDQERVEQFTHLQQSRQTTPEPAAPRLEFVLDECAILRPMPDRGVMRDQLRHLLTKAAESNVTIQIVPLRQAAHRGQQSAFTVLDFDDQEPRALHTSTLTQGFVDIDAESTRPHLTAFQELQDYALSPEESRALIQEAADRHASD